ncbi:hypothetical protein [Halomonas sp. BC2]|uniref:hypothetical protein n=1 Tax=Halomonas sp. BC2 TaxID=1670449 RepID=UPI001BB091E4|nr:hypothetical protein [Halomonas sp. BC2]
MPIEHPPPTAAGAFSWPLTGALSRSRQRQRPGKMHAWNSWGKVRYSPIRPQQ